MRRSNIQHAPVTTGERLRFEAEQVRKGLLQFEQASEKVQNALLRAALARMDREDELAERDSR